MCYKHGQFICYLHKHKILVAKPGGVHIIKEKYALKRTNFRFASNISC